MSAIGTSIFSHLPAHRRVVEETRAGGQRTTRFDTTGDDEPELELLEVGRPEGGTYRQLTVFERDGRRTVYSDSRDGFVTDVRTLDRKGDVVAMERDWNANGRLDEGDEVWNDQGQFRVAADGSLRDETPVISDALPITIYRRDNLLVKAGKLLANVALLPLALLYGLLHRSSP